MKIKNKIIKKGFGNVEVGGMKIILEWCWLDIIK